MSDMKRNGFDIRDCRKTAYLLSVSFFCAVGLMFASSSKMAVADTADTWSAAPINVDNSFIGSGGMFTTTTNGIPFINKLIFFSTAVTALALIIVIIVNGIKVINNDKGPEALKEATKNISLSIAGMILASSAYVVTQSLSYVMYGQADYFTNPELTLFEGKLYDKMKNYIGGATSSNVPSLPEQVFGSFKPIGNGVAAESPIGSNSGPMKLLSSVIGFLVMAASVWLLVAIIWNGYKIITSQSSEVLSKAIRNVGISIIGFLIAVMAYAITSYVINRLFGSEVDINNPVQKLDPSSGSLFDFVWPWG